MAFPQISFFIPAYNCETTLEETVTSIFSGNFRSGDEIVIVNDGSSDGTADVIRLLAERHPEIRAIEHNFNKGGGAARNTGVETASNDTLFCLDSDNLLAPNSVPRLGEFLVNQNCDVASFHELFYFRDNTSNVSHKWRYRSGQVTLSDCLAGAIVPGASGNYMFTRKSWLKAGGYPEFAGALDTWGFGLRQVATGQRMMAMPDSHYFHRCWSESYWVREAKKGGISLKALQLLIPFLDALKKRDVEYVMGRGRYDWFENLDRRPLRLISSHPGCAGTIENDRRRPPELRSGIMKRWIHAWARAGKRHILR